MFVVVLGLRPWNVLLSFAALVLLVWLSERKCPFKDLVWLGDSAGQRAAISGTPPIGGEALNSYLIFYHITDTVASPIEVWYSPGRY